MRIQTKNLAGMVMFVLGVLIISSCSKEDFFGLNEYETLDYSKKAEIALSPEYTNYTIACLRLTKAMDNLGDSTKEQNQGTLFGKPIVYEETGVPIKDLIERLYDAYPELINADMPDFEEIHQIALSKNLALKKMMPGKKGIASTRGNSYTIGDYTVDFYDYAHEWIGTLNYYSGNSPFLDSHAHEQGWDFTSFYTKEYAFQVTYAYLAEHDDVFYSSGGLIFSDNSAVSVVGYGEEWPMFVNNVYPTAEKDFCFVKSEHIEDNVEKAQRVALMGVVFNSGNRSHVIVGPYGEVICE